MVNPVEAKIVIEVSRKYASIFRCDANGAVLDFDHFAFDFRLDKQDAVAEVVDLYSMLYDWLNDTINGYPDEAAREGEPPATTD